MEGYIYNACEFLRAVPHVDIVDGCTLSWIFVKEHVMKISEMNDLLYLFFFIT